MLHQLSLDSDVVLLSRSNWIFVFCKWLLLDFARQGLLSLCSYFIQRSHHTVGWSASTSLWNELLPQYLIDNKRCWCYPYIACAARVYFRGSWSSVIVPVLFVCFCFFYCTLTIHLVQVYLLNLGINVTFEMLLPTLLLLLLLLSCLEHFSCNKFGNGY